MNNSFIAFISLVCTLFVGVWIGYNIGEHSTRVKAAENGFGAYQTIAPGKTQVIWQWNTTNR